MTTRSPGTNDGSQSFTERVITTLADSAFSVFAIDVDGDGDVDALSASANDHSVAWYENDGSQSFTERVITALADHPRSVFAIDVDGDGDVDALSAVRNDDTVAWYENDGAQPFQSFTERIITASAMQAACVFAIDVDDDGDVDVLSASYNDDTVAWYENDGSQSFAEGVITAAAIEAWFVYAIDVDGDGDVDALSASAYDDTIAWYENDGSQSFAERARVRRRLVGTAGAAVDLRRSRVVLAALAVLLGAVVLGAAAADLYEATRAAASGAGGAPVRLRHRPSMDERAYFESRRPVELIVAGGKTFRRFAELMRTEHPIAALFARDRFVSRRAKVSKLGLEVLMFLASCVLESALYYPDPGCEDETSRNGCLKYKNLAFAVFKPRDMCVWSTCAGACAYREPDRADSQSVQHYFALGASLAVLLPLVAVLDRLVETYLEAPNPFRGRRGRRRRGPEAPPRAPGRRRRAAAATPRA
ncbi:endonuclease [Aureococcus anophagefferens]|nr:endonuclease [Aureococcus anophagefferens]